MEYDVPLLQDPRLQKSLAQGLGSSYGDPHSDAMMIMFGLESPEGASPEVLQRLSEIQSGKYNTVEGPHPLMKLGFGAIMAGGGLSALGAAGGSAAGGGLAAELAAGAPELAGTMGLGGATAGATGDGMDWLTQLLSETGELGINPSMLEGGFNASGGGGLLGGLGGLGQSILGGLGNKGIGALLGGAAGMFGGAKQAGTTTTVEDIPEWLKPFALQGMSGLSEAYGATPDGMSPLTAAGGQYMQDVIGGDYLNNNPYLDAMFDKASGKVSAGVNSQFSGAGRYGSGAHQGVLGESLGNLATDIYGQNYAKERGLQQQAAGMSPDFGTASILQPFAKSQALLQGVGGIKGGTSTSPYFRNKPAEILAGALGGASLFN